MRRWTIVAMVALLASSGWAQERLVSVGAGESASGEWTARAAFPTAECEWKATVRIEGPGTLTLCYPARQRMATRRVEGPTEEPLTVSLRLRANPDGAGGPRTLPVSWTFEAGDEPATCWLEPAGGAPMPDHFALQPEPLYQHRIPRVSEPPTIDGDLSDACWDDAAYIGDPYWGMYNRPGDAQMATYVWAAYDDENLYVAFRCETPDEGRLVMNITERDGFAWRDDSAEIFIDLGHDHHRYYEYNITPRGVAFDAKYFYEGGQWLTDWDYIGEWETSIEPGAWIAEIRLSLASFEKRDLRGNPTGEMPLPTGDIAGILFSRNDRVVGEGMSHADNSPSFHEVHQYGHLVGFRPNRPEAYRKTALREIERLERRWGAMSVAAGFPAPIAAGGDGTAGTEGLAEAIGELRSRVEAPAPDFDEWVAINARVRSIDRWLDEARALLAPLTAAHRWADAPWGLAIADPTEPGALPESSRTLRTPERIELQAARGEVVPVQLVVLGDGSGRDVAVVREGLAGARGVIDAITWYALRGGERLVPREPVSIDGPAHLWWEIAVPREAEPGVYHGEIVTTDGEYRVALPVVLTVHDFTLPPTPSLAVSVGFDGPHVMERWYGERSPLGAGEYWPYAQALLRHGVVPREMLADFTWWSDEGIDFGGAERMMARAQDYQPAVRAMIAARAEQLNALEDPVRALRSAIRHWERATGDRPIATWVPPGVTPPEMGPAEAADAVAAAEPGIELEPVYGVGTWAMAPEIATGFGGCEGPRLLAAAGEAGAGRAWRLSESAGEMDTRMLGWLADRYRLSRVFWDGADSEALCASGLLFCEAEDGGRLVDPHPTVELKLLRQALQDYEYLRILRSLTSALGRHAVPNRLWRLRMAMQTQYQRNWDMVMNVREFNRDPEHLEERNARAAEQIVRGRQWLQRVAGESEIPGDAVGSGGR
ncbi:MAG: sugar-binding protein [Armatimonadota bacterium]|jgi:hypothetical protein